VEALTPRGLPAAAPTVTGAATLRPDYGEVFLRWLFAELSRVRARCLLWHCGAAVAHAQDPRAMAAVEQPEALVSRLDGDPCTDTLVEAAP
jgi:hypothetical protein